MIEKALMPDDGEPGLPPGAEDTGEREAADGVPGRLVRATGPEVELGLGEDDDDLVLVVEALIFAAPEPIPILKLSQALPRVAEARLLLAVRQLAARCEREHRPYEVAELAGGYCFLTRPEYAPYIAVMRHSRERERLSPAALETLAIIAYRQPVTRAEIEAIRGVQSGPMLKTLLDRKLVRITGRAEVLGRPLQYGTTKRFMDFFGLKSMADLPKVEELKGQ
ncbi:MAG: SMC-Scp complex subunit ScpB [Planctomycetota bacterium]